MKTTVTKLIIEPENHLHVPVYVFSNIQDFGGWVAEGCPDISLHSLVWKWGKPGTYIVNNDPLSVTSGPTRAVKRSVWYRELNVPRYLDTGETYVMWAVVTHRQSGEVNPFSILVETYV